MTKTEMINETAAHLSMRKADVKRALEYAMGLVREAAANGDVVTLSGFGSFRRKDVPAKPARMGRNPATGETMRLKAKPKSKKLVFRFAKAWKDML